MDSSPGLHTVVSDYTGFLLDTMTQDEFLVAAVKWKGMIERRNAQDTKGTANAPNISTGATIATQQMPDANTHKTAELSRVLPTPPGNSTQMQIIPPAASVVYSYKDALASAKRQREAKTSDSIPFPPAEAPITRSRSASASVDASRRPATKPVASSLKSAPTLRPLSSLPVPPLIAQPKRTDFSQSNIVVKELPAKALPRVEPPSMPTANHIPSEVLTPSDMQASVKIGPPSRSRRSGSATAKTIRFAEEPMDVDDAENAETDEEGSMDEDDTEYRPPVKSAVKLDKEGGHVDRTVDMDADDEDDAPSTREVASENATSREKQKRPRKPSAKAQVKAQQSQVKRTKSNTPAASQPPGKRAYQPTGKEYSEKCSHCKDSQTMCEQPKRPGACIPCKMARQKCTYSSERKTKMKTEGSAYETQAEDTQAEESQDEPSEGEAMDVDKGHGESQLAPQATAESTVTQHQFLNKHNMDAAADIASTTSRRHTRKNIEASHNDDQLLEHIDVMSKKLDRITSVHWPASTMMDSIEYIEKRIKVLDGLTTISSRIDHIQGWMQKIDREHALHFGNVFTAIEKLEQKVVMGAVSPIPLAGQLGQSSAAQIAVSSPSSPDHAQPQPQPPLPSQSDGPPRPDTAISTATQGPASLQVYSAPSSYGPAASATSRAPSSSPPHRNGNMTSASGPSSIASPLPSATASSLLGTAPLPALGDVAMDVDSILPREPMGSIQTQETPPRVKIVLPTPMATRHHDLRPSVPISPISFTQHSAFTPSVVPLPTTRAIEGSSEPSIQTRGSAFHHVPQTPSHPHATQINTSARKDTVSGWPEAGTSDLAAPDETNAEDSTEDTSSLTPSTNDAALEALRLNVPNATSLAPPPRRSGRPRSASPNPMPMQMADRNKRKSDNIGKPDAKRQRHDE